MAIKKTIEIEAKTKGAAEEIEKLTKEVKNLEKQVNESNKETADSLGNIEESSKTAAGGIKKIGTTIKAIGIGLLLAAFAKLKEVFEQNQKVVDFFNITFEALSLAFNDFFNFLDSNIGTVVGYFKDIFNDPLQAVKDLGNAIKDNIIERFNSALEVAGYLGSALKKLFSGDFTGALDDAKSAGSEFVDVLTGVDDSANKIAEAVSTAAQATSKYVKETVKSAQAIVELNKAAATAEIRIQGLLEQYDRQAEKLRQVRDEERNTIEERIKANNDLNALLDEQEAAMLRQVDLQIASAQAQYDKNANQENYNNLLRVTQEREAVLAQIEGFRSEQKINDLALFREQLELYNSLRDAEFERAIANEEFNASLIGNDVARIQRLQEIATYESNIREKQLQDDLARTKLGTQAQIDATNALFSFQQENANKQKQLDRDLAEAKLAVISGALGGVAKLIGEGSTFGKAVAITQAVIDTYAGANKALAQGGIYGGIAAAGIIASGLANVKSIVATQEPELPSYASGGSAAVSAPQPRVASFNIVGETGTNQLAETISSQTRQPIKAYVVASDVTTAQSLDRNIVQGASI